MEPVSERPVTITLPVAFQPEDLVAIAPHFRLQWEEAQDRYVLLYPEGMVQLSDTAGEILTHCKSSQSVGTIIDRMQALYPEDDIAGDVRDFLHEAAANGWIRAQSGP